VSHTPNFDGAGGHAEGGGHLLEGEQAGDEPVERGAFAAGEAAVVEDLGDFGVGVGVEQVVDGGEDVGGVCAAARPV